MPITPPPSDTPGDHAGDPEAYDASRKSWYVWFQGFCVELLAYIDVVAAAATAAANAVLTSKVTGPASSTDNTIPRFDGTTGKLVQGSGVAVDDNGNLTLSAGALGYGAGAGGTVTQVTSKATAVTLNKPCGTITMHNAALAAGASVAFTLNNTFFGSYDAVVLVGKSWSARYRIESANSATGLIGIRVTNTEAISCSDPLEISFAIIKGASA